MPWRWRLVVWAAAAAWIVLNFMDRLSTNEFFIGFFVLVAVQPLGDFVYKRFANRNAKPS